MQPIYEVQVHVLVGCADARDVQLVHVEAVRETRDRWRERGVDARFHAIRVPGAFASNEVITDVRRIIHETPVPAGLPARYFVHIQSHGAVESHVEDRKPRAYELEIVANSPLNCGMLNATSVAVDIETRLLEVGPEFTLRHGRRLKIEHEQDIRTLLREVYGYDGYFAGDWVRSIDDLRTHARGQRSMMERAFANDPEFRRLDIWVTAGIQDYRNHRHLRTDADEVEAPFWDDLHAAVHDRAEAHPEIVAAQARTQNPLAGFIGMSDVEQSPRAIAAAYLAKELACTDPYPSLFALAGASHDRPHIPFGPYTIAGMYYLLHNLKTKDVGVMGADAEQTARMVAKLRQDPLMAFILEDGGARLHPFSLADHR